MAIIDSLVDSARRLVNWYHSDGFYHWHFGKPVAKMKRELLYAYQLAPLTAAVAAHGVANKWEAVPVVPLTNNDEVHAIWPTPADFDYRQPVLVRWGLIPNNASSALTITTTYSTIDMGSTLTGSDVAGDGGTALNKTIAAIANSDTTANVPFMSQIGVISGLTTDYDILHIKGVASGQAGADRLRVFCLEIYYVPRTA